MSIQDNLFKKLGELGASGNTIDDRWNKFLLNSGYRDGAVPDRKNKWLREGGSLASNPVNLFLDPSFDNGIDEWTRSSVEITVDIGKLTITGLQTGSIAVFQNDLMELGKTYRLTWEIEDYVAGQSRALIGSSGGVGPWNTGAGEFSFEIEYSAGTSRAYIQFDSSFVGSITNATLVEV